MNNSLIVNYNWNSKTINEILRLKLAYSSGTDSIVGEYKQKIKEWSKLNDNIFSDNIFFNLDNNDKEKINLIFWMLNIILFNENKLWNEYLEVIVKLILIFENEYFIEDKKNYLSMIMNFKNRLLFTIDDKEVLIFNKDSISLDYSTLDVEDAKSLIKYFIKINKKQNLYPSTVKRNYDYTLCPQNLYSILELLYYLCTIKEEFMTKEIISNLNNFYNKRFYFILLNNNLHFSEDKKDAYINKFKKKKEWIYEDEFLFIILSKMNDQDFVNFLTSEIDNRYKNSEFSLKAGIFWKYYNIYKYYKKDFNLQTENSLLKDLLNYRNLSLNKPKTVEELEHQIWFNDKEIAYNSFSGSRSIYDVQEQKALVINNYNNYEKIIYLADQVSSLMSGKGFFYAEVDGIIKKLNTDLNEMINILNDSNEFEKISETVKNFIVYKDDFKKNLPTNLALLKSYLIDFKNMNKINDELSKFCKKYCEDSSINNLKLNKNSCDIFLNELNECFKLEFNSENSKYNNIFLLCKINDEFLSVLSSFCFGNRYLKEIEIFLPYLEKIIDNVLSLKETQELNFLKEVINLQLKLNKYCILTKKTSLFSNNIFVIKYNIFFQKTKNFMKEYFEKKIFKEDKKFYLLILLKSIFFEGYKAHLEAVKHLNFIMDSEYILTIFMENFGDKYSNLNNEEWDKRENKETSIFYINDIKKNQIILWSLFSICCFSNDFRNDKFESFKKVYNKCFEVGMDYKSLRIYELIGNVYININYQISLKEITQEKSETMKTLGNIIIWFLKGLIYNDHNHNTRLNALINYKISDYEYEECYKYLNNEFRYNWSNFNKDEIEIKLLIINALIIFTDLTKYGDKLYKLSDEFLEEKEILQKALNFGLKNLEKENMWIFKNINIFKNHFSWIQRNLDILNS